MLYFRQPTDSDVQGFLQSQAQFGYTYPDTGATAAIPPANYVVDHTRVRLGTGTEVFHRAKKV